MIQQQKKKNFDPLKHSLNNNSVLSLKKNNLGLHVFCLATLDPLFEQVFIVAVSSRAKCEHSFVGELATVGVDEHGHQTILFPWQLVDQFHDFICRLL